MKFLLLTLVALAPFTTFSAVENESELGIILSKGNSDSESVTLKQTTSYKWEEVNAFKMFGRALQTKTKNVENARYWTLGARYDRNLSQDFGWYFGVVSEGDKYAGYDQRYNSDLGAKYIIFKNEMNDINLELGYRYTLENPMVGENKKSHYTRAYTEASQKWTEGVSTKLWLEYLPNLTTGSDYQINTEASISASLNNVFAIKTSYLLRYDHLPSVGATTKTDSLLTTSLVAKF